MSDPADDGFLSRWSRRKVQVRQGVPVPAQATVAAAAPVMPAAVSASAAVERPQSELPQPAPAAVPAPTLDDVAQLTPASDFSRFVAPGVDADVRNAAMKKLFADPHYNVMDGLDTYIDDYGKFEPVPRSMLRQMVQARTLGLLDDELEDQQAPLAVATVAAAPATLAAPSQPPAAADGETDDATDGTADDATDGKPKRTDL